MTTRRLAQPEQPDRVIKRDRNVRAPRERLWAADPHCQSCGKLVELNAGENGFHLDHIVPLFEGGKDVDDNKQVLCILCHKAKSASEEASKLRFQRGGGVIRFGGWSL